MGPERSLRNDLELRGELMRRGMRGVDLQSSLDSNNGNRRGRLNRDSQAGLVRRNSMNDVPIIINDNNSDGGRHPGSGRWRVHHLRDGNEFNLGVIRGLAQVRDLGPIDVRNYVLSEKVSKLKSESRANFIFLQLLIIFLLVMGT